ncbi:MAG: hypothetical protein JWP89_6499 [Schlesneria sp.]|nr:hypothetical protein [Schlesneria sp.]
MRCSDTGGSDVVAIVAPDRRVAERGALRPYSAPFALGAN